MSKQAQFEEQQEETRQIIQELLEDGSDPDAVYVIEHHLSCKQFEVLEKAVVEAFKLSYEISDAEELEIEDGSILFCCDVISEIPLKAELIDEQVKQLMALAERFNVNYDGWGTYFEDPDAEDAEDEDDEGEDAEFDHEERGTRH